MGNKDITSKTLESYNDVFADMVNVFLFDGRQVVQPDELSPADISSQYKADSKIHSQERDVFKLWKNVVIKFALIGFENQAKPYKFMPVRIFSYDGSSYREQLNKDFLIVDSVRGKLCCPVITVVIYFGSDNWNYGTELYDCVYVPDELKPFVNNYKMNFYALKDMNISQVEKFTSDFRIIAEFFADNTNNEKTPAFSDKLLDHPQETLDMIGIFSGDDRYLDAYNEVVVRTSKEGVTMSNIYIEMLDKAEAKAKETGWKNGVAEGRAKGIAEGRSDLVRTLLSVGRSIKEIAEFFKTDESEIEKMLSAT